MPPAKTTLVRLLRLIRRPISSSSTVSTVARPKSRVASVRPRSHVLSLRPQVIGPKYEVATRDSRLATRDFCLGWAAEKDSVATVAQALVGCQARRHRLGESASSPIRVDVDALDHGHAVLARTKQILGHRHEPPALAHALVAIATTQASNVKASLGPASVQPRQLRSVGMAQ